MNVLYIGDTDASGVTLGRWTVAVTTVVWTGFPETPRWGARMTRMALLTSMALGCHVSLATAAEPIADRSLAKYDQLVADSRRCEAEERCSLAGGVKGCRCPVSVRAGTKARVEAAARAASCAAVERLYCPPFENPRCKNNVCVADQVRE